MEHDKALSDILSCTTGTAEERYKQYLKLLELNEEFQDEFGYLNFDVACNLLTEAVEIMEQFIKERGEK